MSRSRNVRSRKHNFLDWKVVLQFLGGLTALIVALTGLVDMIIKVGTLLHWW
jgi:hypothetical protein